jgi:[ribosomal protein S5]-alanine N-acetyltransferase
LTPKGINRPEPNTVRPASIPASAHDTNFRKDPLDTIITMTHTHLTTKNLKLISLTREETLAMVDAMSPEDRAQVSADWLAALRASKSVDPWRHWFNIVLSDTDRIVGSCGFKGPPAEGFVEIAYGIEPGHQGNGYATEAAEALTNFAFVQNVPTVRAHTLPEVNASTRVLTKCGFQQIGQVIDPDDGPVWRWERYREPRAT